MDILIGILKKRYPYLKTEGIQKAIGKAFNSMYQPYDVDEFLIRPAQKMYEIPFSLLVKRTKV